MSKNVASNKLSNDEFYSIQRDVLKQWPTGADVYFEEAVEYHKSIPLEKRFYHALDQAVENNRTLIQPRAGVALSEGHIKLLKYLEEKGGADLLPTTIDSYTRHNRYEEANIGIRESRSQGRSLLNGFPAVNHGIAICREVTSSVSKPVQVRHGTPDARLLTEITTAGGFTSNEGGGISYNIPYSKNISLEKTIKDWQYCDRLIGLYEEAGVTINREPFGPLTGTLVPPSIAIAVGIIESILAVEQGCTHITVGYGQGGNLIQDIAALKTLKTLTKRYLRFLGHHGITVTTVMHQWMGGFPKDESKSFGVISWGAATAVLGGATKVIVKTPHEAMGVPTMEANAQGLRTTKQLINMLSDQNLSNTPSVNEESELLEMEVESIVNSVQELGEGDFALGTIRAFEAGFIDIPFAPSKFNAGKVLPARDNNGAVRFLSTGNLPFRDDVKTRHKDFLASRAREEKRDVSFQMVIDDVYAISKGNLVGRPRKNKIIK